MRDYEEALCAYVAPLIPADCHVIVLADRGFGAVRLFRFLDGLGWDWVIRGKGNILVRWKSAWRPICLLAKGRPLQWDDHVDYGKRAAGGSYAGRLVIYADEVHPDPWFLLVSPGLAGRSWGQVVALYAKRFTCEESYKDQKESAQRRIPHEFGAMGHRRWVGSYVVSLRLGLLLAQCRRMGSGTPGSGSGLACQHLRKTHPCVMALRFLGPPTP